MSKPNPDAKKFDKQKEMEKQERWIEERSKKADQEANGCSCIVIVGLIGALLWGINSCATAIDPDVDAAPKTKATATTSPSSTPSPTPTVKPSFAKNPKPDHPDDMPDLVGLTWRQAEKKMGTWKSWMLRESAWSDRNDPDGGSVIVCSQDTKPGKIPEDNMFSDEPIISIKVVAKSDRCPRKDEIDDAGYAWHDKPKPKPDVPDVPDEPATSGGTSIGGGSSSGGGSDHYNPNGCPPGGCDNSRHCPPGGCTS